MDYLETIDYLFNSTPVFEHIGAAAYKPGLQNSHDLDAYFNHPHTKYKIIHIAGTNGKGSVAHSLAAILQSSGLKVGLYTSPHLVDFRERIKVNGISVDKQYVVDFVQKHRDFFEPLSPSFFELTTAMAFHYFAEKEVDVAVVEVGLGGRLDCTNIVTPVLSIITNISFDHTQQLGSTLEAIATEKAGIIKKNIPVVIGEYTAETRKVFEQKAIEMNAPITFAQDDVAIKLCDNNCETGFDFETTSYGKLHAELGGIYQRQNVTTILAAVTYLENIFNITRQNISCGFAHVCELTGLQGRWQTIGKDPLIICDTGHNLAGWTYLVRQITSQKCDNLRIVFGMVDDKDVQAVMELLPSNAEYYWTQASTKRAIPSKKIMGYGSKLNLHGTSFLSVADAFKAAVNDSAVNDFIYVGGSSYVVADLLTFLQTDI